MAATQAKVPDEKTGEDNTSSTPAQAPKTSTKKATKRKAKEDPRGTLRTVNGVKLYVKG